MRAAEPRGRRTGGEERRRGGGVWRSSGELGGVATTWEECGGVGRSAREGGVRRRAEASWKKDPGRARPRSALPLKNSRACLSRARTGGPAPPRHDVGRVGAVTAG